MSVTSIWLLHSFFLPSHISSRLLAGKASEFELWYAKNEQLSAYSYYQTVHNEVGSTLWLRGMRELATTQGKSALTLARFYIENNNPIRGDYWLSHATALGSLPAKQLLVERSLADGKLKQASAVLQTMLDETYGEYYLWAIIQAIELAMRNGEQQKIELLAKKLKSQAPEHDILVELAHFSVLGINDQQPDVDCIASVQIYAATLHDLRRTEQLIDQFAQSKLNKYVCLTVPRYMPLSTLNCQHDPNEAIRCDETIWQTQLTNIQTRFLGVMLPSGGANVNHGIMYLDRHDKFSVFMHEIAHLLGFIDEYPLPQNHAKCMVEQQASFSHNVVVLPASLTGDKSAVRRKVLQQLPWFHLINDDTPILTAKDGYWQLGTPTEFQGKVGLFKTRTCAERQPFHEQAAKLQAFKPISNLTKLAHHELELPELYYQLLQAAPEKFLMPSFHRNIEIAQSIDD
ncbi:hypothetical protein [Thalassotalea sp. G2M2-11]|uniref:hypothetical protein n=1 Tax=Thalassotalea sp. G2M2-11 TaxID=2787627 RepID=UPI0019D19261|nr:hypothetical protein [Thalassotalea sp. G2M2-11]